MSGCKVIEKCKKCKCSKKAENGLASQIQVPRPTERVIEREIVELSSRCDDCDCKNKNLDTTNV